MKRRLSTSSSGIISPRPAAPGYSLEELKGFREIADYMSRDGDCILARRFGVLRFRDLLCKQAQVAEVERHLALVDSGELFGHGDVETVRGLMRELDTKLKAYDEALERCHRVYTMPHPSARSLHESSSWLRTRKFDWHIQVQQPEEDIVTLDRGLITDGPITRTAALIARVVFKKEVTRRAGVDQLSSEHSIYVSRVLISLIAPVILLVPVVLLCYVRKLWAQIIVVVLATVISSFAMMVAKAGNAEVFMATSAYAAVMVVFLGTVADVSGNGKG
ncbi:hypothetical protein HOY80DRAFT_1008735 [Tuber brumale]|nr:hypothetical protein HOY80DRAFT_1008735 [Tuber brumale]